ncbi:MAG TPA: VanZ family protein [Candidatus Hydrogenedentes bacterium]|nr:VanZ family protein [Candidatus Hydrogenedentota bacterium]HRK34494.1 VanZ family protein [Candidatus Hydrogenedentota bacterium]
MRWPYLLATAVYCGLIWRMSADTDPPTWTITWQIEGLDKVFHAAVYAILGAIVSVGMRRSGKSVSAWAQCFVPVLFAALYGLTDEIHQIYVPNRQFDLGDLIADFAGACMAQCVLCYFYWRKPA